MKRVLVLAALMLVLVLSLTAPVMAGDPYCSCPYCIDNDDLYCLTSNNNRISCPTYLMFAACPAWG
jgi:hypothetical protein